VWLTVAWLRDQLKQLLLVAPGLDFADRGHEALLDGRGRSAETDWTCALV
jgi:hypothetical protein